MAAKSPSNSEIYTTVIKQNLARKLEGGTTAVVRQYASPVLLFLIMPTLVFWLMSNWFNAIVPFPQSLHLAPTGAEPGALIDAICTGGAFTEQRLLWAAGAWASLVACLALAFYAAYSMRIYFSDSEIYSRVLVGVTLLTILIGTLLRLGERLYHNVFPDYFTAVLSTAACRGVGGEQHAFGFLRYFDIFFDVINFSSVGMCVMVATSLIFTVTNVSAFSDTGFLRRQHQRFRTLLYLGSVVLVIGVWQLGVWANWPTEVLGDLRSRSEKSETASKARLAWIDAKLKEIAETPAYVVGETVRPVDLIKSRRDARDAEGQAVVAKPELERRQVAAEKIGRGFTAFLGVLYSLLLILLFAPAWALLNRATRLHAIEKAKPPNTGTPEAWLSANGFSFTFTDQLKPVIAIVAPLLAASMTNILGTLTGK